MYTSISIKNFRCLEEITLNPLDRLNLIAGKNNTGKTALLEALWLHQGPQNPELGFRITRFRGLEEFKGDELLWDLFRNFDYNSEIEVVSQDVKGKSRSLRITIRERTTSQVSLEAANLTKETMEKEVSTTEAVEQEILIQHIDELGQATHSRAFIVEKDLRLEGSPVKLPTGTFLSARGRGSAKADV